MHKEKTTQAAIIDLIDNLEFEKFNEAPIKKSEETSKNHFKKPIDFANIDGQQEIIKPISPDRCKSWALADRHELEMGDIKSLALSIKTYGQQEPILARPIAPQEGGIEFEIIFGNRRWRACKLINIPVKAIIRNVSDQDAAIAQKEENENRKEISDFSKAIHYKNLLDKKIFSTMAELSQKMGVGKATLSDLMSYTRIDTRIISSIKCPHRVSKKAASKLAALSQNISDKSLQALLKIIPDIESGIISARQIESAFLQQELTLNESYSKQTDLTEIVGSQIQRDQNIDGTFVFKINTFITERQAEKIEAFILKLLSRYKLVRPAEQNQSLEGKTYDN